MTTEILHLMEKCVQFTYKSQISKRLFVIRNHIRLVKSYYGDLVIDGLNIKRRSMQEISIETQDQINAAEPIKCFEDDNIRLL